MYCSPDILHPTAPQELLLICLNADFCQWTSPNKLTVPIMPQPTNHRNRLMPLEVEDAVSKLTQQISCYMVLSLFYRLRRGSSPTGAYGLSYDIVKDCEMILEQVLRAFNNPSTLKFRGPAAADLTFR